MSTKACKYLMHFSVLNLQQQKLQQVFLFFPPTLSLSFLKFNRCITSQLIKWFSNFREFYYIQMEKFARQAINDGVTGVEEMSVSRDCELFRALNMHYNKANDFEVSLRPLPLFHTTAFTLSGHTVLRGEIHSDA